MNALLQKKEFKLNEIVAGQQLESTLLTRGRYKVSFFGTARRSKCLMLGGEDETGKISKFNSSYTIQGTYKQISKYANGMN